MIAASIPSWPSSSEVPKRFTRLEVTPAKAYRYRPLVSKAAQYVVASTGVVVPLRVAGSVVTGAASRGAVGPARA